MRVPVPHAQAVVAAIVTDSAALLAYGLESFVDLSASVLVVWRFWDNTDNAAGLRSNLLREERANVGIAATVLPSPYPSLSVPIPPNPSRLLVRIYGLSHAWRDGGGGGVLSSRAWPFYSDSIQ